MNKHFYLGIDVSKGYADFCLINQNKSVEQKSFQLDDTFDGHNQLFRFLSDFFAKYPDAKLFAAVESTGGYENNWYNCLHKYSTQFNIYVARVNPYGVNYSSKATLERIITDKQSAKNIATYMISHPEKVCYSKTDYYSAQRKLVSVINMITKQIVQLLNELESIVYNANPEMLNYFRNGVNQWTLKVLKSYPTAKHLARARVSALSKLPHVDEIRANELIETAKTSVASATDECTAETVKLLVNQIVSLKKLKAKQLKYLEKTCNIPEVKLLTSFNGISTHSAVGLMLEIVSVTRFSSAKKLACFFGVHPVFKQSGDGLSGYKMSKRGRKEPRRLLFNIARFAIVHNPLIKEIYASYLQRGMCKMSAIGALMHKILRIIFGMLKNNTAFDPDIDRRYRNRKLVQDKNNSKAKKDEQRLLNEKAPISRRNYKKRKELNLTQDD